MTTCELFDLFQQQTTFQQPVESSASERNKIQFILGTVN